jgi:hypothetical protein
MEPCAASRVRPSVRAWWRGALLPAAIFAVALALRLPFLSLVPAYSDEGNVALWGLDIARGRHLPLTSIDPYFGPYFAYLLAALFTLFGVHLDLPRLTVAVFGALVPVATYGLGRVMWGRTAGLVAAGLAATSPVLIVYGSHQAWPPVFPPFFMTTTLLALVIALACGSVWLYALAGALAGMTLQAHPITASGLVGLGLWLLSTRKPRQWLTEPGLYAALAGWVVTYATMIAANARLNSPMIEVAWQRGYAFAPTADPVEYATRVFWLLAGIAYSVGAGTVAPTFSARLALGTLGLVVLGAALLLLWRRGSCSIALALLSTLLLQPILVKSLEHRYYFAIVPLAYVAVGALAAEALRELRRAPSWFDSVLPSAWIGAPPRLRSVAAAGVVALVAVAILSPFVTVPMHYARMVTIGSTNAEFHRLVEIARANGACGARFFIDPALAGPADRQTHALTMYTRAVSYVLDLSRCPHAWVTADEMAERLSHGDGTGWLLEFDTYLDEQTRHLRSEPVATFTLPMFSRRANLVLARVQLLR